MPTTGSPKFTLSDLQAAAHERTKVCYPSDVDIIPERWAIDAMHKAMSVVWALRDVAGTDVSPRETLVDGIADTVIYLSHLCDSLGVDLGTVVLNRFNATSRRCNSDQILE